jgi:hypothetical protein
MIRTFIKQFIGSVVGAAILVIAGTGCATRGDITKAVGRVDRNVDALSDRLNTQGERLGNVETLAKGTAKAVDAVAMRVTAVETNKATTAYVDAETKKLTEAMKEIGTKADADIKAAVNAESTARGEAIKGVQEQVAAQATKNAKLAALFRAFRSKNKLRFDQLKFELGDKAASDEVQCWGFASGDADLGSLLKRNPGCKADLDRIVAKIKRGEAAVFGGTGYEDIVPCKKPVTDACRNVARLRIEAMLAYVGANVKLGSTAPPTGEVGASPAENRGAVLYLGKPKPPAEKKSGWWPF